ncbi:PREDICTED: macrophage erythroblast attacher [Papilio polytes]|uniref:macrophage erythroblast attacher n=1 Tax=Papilio polytes TaxID=76194 RepID=UPI000675F735|nr:PREDICTED: macrophage erythroblast attacher [Papilio polytes]
MNEIKSLEHATLKIYLYPKSEPNSFCSFLNFLIQVEKLTTMKRKASEAINEEVQAAYVCKKRLDHLKEQAEALQDPVAAQTSLNQWRKVRLDRMLVDYFLRNGYYDSATKLADAKDLRDLTNVDIYQAAAQVERELAARRTARGLQWCADNKSKLRKINSTMEFNIRIQEFIELVRAERRLEAVRYAKKHFSSYEEGQLRDIQHCMGMLAFPSDTGNYITHYASTVKHNYGEKALKEMMKEHGSITCPKTKEVFCMKRVEKVYVM